MQIQDCEFPDDILIDVQNDVWLKPLSEGTARVGVTSILAFLAGRFEKFNPKTKLGVVSKGQALATLESPRYFAAVRAPVAGVVRGFNQTVEQDPKLINLSPYEKGWIAELAEINLKECELLARPIDAATLLESRIKELRVRCFKKLPDEDLYSIGLECSATLANLDELLSKRAAGTVVHIVSDDPLAEIEIVRWADQRDQILLETRKEDNLYHFLVEKK